MDSRVEDGDDATVSVEIESVGRVCADHAETVDKSGVVDRIEFDVLGDAGFDEPKKGLGSEPGSTVAKKREETELVEEDLVALSSQASGEARVSPAVKDDPDLPLFGDAVEDRRVDTQEMRGLCALDGFDQFMANCFGRRVVETF